MLGSQLLASPNPSPSSLLASREDPDLKPLLSTFLAGMPMGHNGGPKLSVPSLCVLDREAGGDQSFCCHHCLALPCLVPFAAGTRVALFNCLYALRTGKCPSCCATAHPQDTALLTPTTLLIPALPEESSLPGQMELHSGVS